MIVILLMRSFPFLPVLLGLCLGLGLRLQAQEGGEAEKFYREKSYAQAAAIWEKQLEAEKPDPAGARGRELAYRIADAQWRALASTQQSDRTVYEPWTRQLRKLTEKEPADLWSALAWESLGNQSQIGRRWWGMDWNQARADYEKALQFWADSDASDEARRNYLRIVFTWLEKGGDDYEPLYYRYRQTWSLPVAENAVKLAQTPEEKAAAHFFLAGALQQSGGASPMLWKRIDEAFKAATTAGPKTEWRDDALYAAGEWENSQGRLQEISPGQYQARPDYEAALQYFGKLRDDYGKGESRWRDDALRLIEDISKAQVNVNLGNAFLPESKIQFGLQTRNVDRVELSVAKLDLVQALWVKGAREMNDYSRTRKVSQGIGEVLRKWSVETGTAEAHEIFNKVVETEPLPAGAYWLQAKAGSVQSGAILLVTNTVVNVMPFPGKILVFVCESESGAPVPESKITVLRYGREKNSGSTVFNTVSIQAQTGRDGTAVVAWPEKDDLYYEYGGAVITMANGMPAMLNSGWYGINRRNFAEAKTYVYTDRPAYRPDDTVQFKFIQRETKEEIYSTPGGREVTVRVNDPRGEKLLEKSYRLNDYGSAADSFKIPKEAPLGIYHIQFNDKATGRGLGGQELFRLEEYKLPEFRVTVKLPEKDGVPQTFRLGDKVKALVQVEYYSGGPVPNAEVEFDLFQKPFPGDNPWPEPYPWLYRGIRCSAPWMGFWQPRYGDNLIKRDKTKTNAAGEAVIEIDTPPGFQGLEYRVEARVTDSSRRQVSGSGSVKVTPFAYALHLRPEAQVVQPRDTARIQGKALDANNKPQQVKGTAVITRDVYVEKSRVSKRTGQATVYFRGYESKEVDRRDFESDKEGKFRIDYQPPESGYYKVKVVSPPAAKNLNLKNPAPAADRVMAETAFFAADAKTSDLGYRMGALQLFPDKQTYKIGDTARVVVVAPEAKSTALLMMKGNDLLGHQVLDMNGRVRLVEFKITEACEPNLFFSGFMVLDGRPLVAMEEVVVPPVEHYLKVEVLPDSVQKKPGEKGAQILRVTDGNGKAVKAELSVGVVDAAIYYIQPDLAPDIREFFFGEKRDGGQQMQSMLNQLSVLRVVDPGEEQEQVSYPAEAPPPPPAPGALRRSRGFGDEGFALASASAPMAQADMAAEMPMGGARGKSLREESKLDRRDQDAKQKASAADIGAQVDEGGPEVVVRSDFRATAFWKPDLVTDAKGEARIELQYPDSLTEWKTVARAVTTGAQFGPGESEVKTAQPVMCRLQVPRFVVERDEVTLSAVVSNQTGKEISVQVALEAKNLEPIGTWQSSGKIPAKSQKRFDRVFRVKAASGVAEVSASAKSAEGGDAMKLSLPILEHGIEKFIARSSVLDPAKGVDRLEWNLDLPAERNPGSASLQFVLAPSLASTCLDALPYLANYPYGCVEQTMSRFMPAAITAQVLKEMKLEPEAVAGRIFGGMEKGSAEALKMKKGNLADLDKMLKQGIDRLRDMQHGDGGWGWWKQDETNDFMTAYVVQGLALGKKAGAQVDVSMARRGADYLKPRLVEYENDPSMQAWLLYAVALGGSDWDGLCRKAADRCWNDRDKLNAYTRSLLALAFQARIQDGGDYAQRAKVLVQNLENGVKEVKAESALIGARGSATMPVTCHWGEDGVSYRWSEGGVEATAFALRAMLAVDPSNPRIDQAARWLINNRRGAQWKNTRDTAIVVMSLLDYMRQSKETAPKLKADLKVNGKTVKTVEFSSENALGTLSFDLPEAALAGGANRIELQVQGEGRLYASAFMKYFTKEEPITAAGNEIYVKREYYRETAVPKLLGGSRLEKTLLKDGDEIQSGDRIEVRLLLEAKNNYEFLVFEDKKPAGCEAVQVRSGEPMFARAQQANGKFEGDSTFVYQELRDVQVAFFVTKLRSGVHEVRYMLRAETPGKFHALPTLGHAMYVPEIRANSDEMRIRIVDAENR